MHLPYSKNLKLFILAVVLLIPAASDVYGAQYYSADKKTVFRMLLGFRGGYGGDTVGRIVVAGSEVDGFVAGKGAYVYAGNYFNINNDDWSLLGRVGFKKGNFQSLSNGNYFRTFPADFGVSLAKNVYRLNFGMTRHFHPKYDKSLNARAVLSPLALIRDEKYNNANGLFFEYAYEFTEGPSYLVLRYTNIEYEMDLTSTFYKFKDTVDASSFSVGFELGFF